MIHDRRLKNDTSTAIALVVALVVLAFTLIGWVSNIMKLMSSDFDPVTGLDVARCFGVIIPPLGAVLGFV